MDESDADTTRELDALRVRSQADLQRMWELVMRPLGFRATSLWVTFLGSDLRPTRLLIEVAEADQVPDAEMVRHLFWMLEQVVDQDGDDLTVAFLLARPGRDGLTDFDRAVATALLAGARRSPLSCAPVHVADDLRVQVVAPDDLAA